MEGGGGYNAARGLISRDIANFFITIHLGYHLQFVYQMLT